MGRDAGYLRATIEPLSPSPSPESVIELFF
jgi:hypothetical protein